MFQYGNAWEDFDIRKGEIWNVGPHKVMVGDVVKGDLSKLLDIDKIDLIFTDPPWNNQITRQFYKHSGEYQELDFDELLGIFFT